MLSIALAEYCEAIIAISPSRWPVRKLLNQFGRYYAAYMLIHNYYGWLGDDPALPTLSRLKRLSSLSPRHTTHFVGVLKTAGFVTSEPVAVDRRQTLLRPEPVLVEEIGRSILAFLAAHDRIAGTAHAAFLSGSVERIGAIIHLSARQILAGGTVISPFPTIAAMANYDCGYPVLVALMAAHYASEARRPVPLLTLEPLAERFQVSKSHVGNVFSYLSSVGLIDAGRGVRPALVEEFERWSVAEMNHYALLAARLTSDHGACGALNA
ncbi:hypothetical protein JVX98_04200 (plasmid) [Ensifer sp. PDNC004]|uniref:hypothetical protein n=1 Tax=unclassified Ensifer TaxID=2633371 RepID=UPI001783C532|nr:MULTISPECIES: hypothetical protein [unclassified Ensifer]MBD9652841.1 hypothetical protein [Ensifer sp. ENS09]QRY64869.1 hypothetical protein JVX98_04200 [Ensifer sp. PDNC004]